MVAGEGEGFDGDPGDAGDEGAGAGDAEEKALRPLPDPDDRLWRHPSEATPGEIPGPVVGPVLPGPGRRRGRGWPDEAGRHRWRSGGHLVGVALVAGAVGALLTTGLLLASGRIHAASPTLPAAGSSGAGAQAGATPTLAPAPDTTAAASRTTVPPGRTTVPGTAPPTSLVNRSVAGSNSSPSMVMASPGVQAMAERVLPGLVTVTATTSSGTRHGTGLVFRSDGMILTAVPLVAGAASVTVTARDGRHWEGAVVGQDARTGVAVVQIPGSGVGFGPLGPPPSLHVGQLVLAVTAGPTPEAPLSISLGVVDAVHQQVHLSGGQSIPDAIESDAHPSNASGGVLLDQQGRIIGLLEANLSLPDGQGCVATPVALASWAAGQLASSGHVAHAWLGVDGGNVPAGHSDALDRRGGALVDRVQPASPAAAAGLVPGDVVDSVNGHPVTSMNDLQRALLPLTPGTAVELGVDRHGHQLTLRVVLGPA